MLQTRKIADICIQVILNIVLKIDLRMSLAALLNVSYISYIRCESVKRMSLCESVAVWTQWVEMLFSEHSEFVRLSPARPPSLI